MAIKSLLNIVITYNSNAMAAHLDQASLEATVETIDTTTFASTAQEKTPGATSYSIPVGGPWSKALDDILGADTVSPPSTLRTFVYQIGPSGNRVTYTWTGSATVGAFISDYKVVADDPMGVVKWTGTLTISGAPTRA
jgi:hypothetical protein